jgi:hypothetical protein
MKHLQPPLDGEILPPRRQQVWQADDETHDLGETLILLALGFACGVGWTALAVALWASL